tara:strand:+ start:81 stop:233 length:153 start_codon:yes stop_codon:yes gene_type:complete
MNRSNSQDIDKNPSFVSYADMVKKSKEVKTEVHIPKNPEKFVKLTKKSSK